jgi:hypothetical protein
LVIGEPVPIMLLRVKYWLADNKDVRIFTARAYPPGAGSAREVAKVEAWCVKHVGQKLPVTCMKDPQMKEFYDDRAIQVEFNTGKIIE